MKDLKTLIRAAKNTIPSPDINLNPQEVLEDREALQEDIRELRRLEQIKARLMSCKTANDVFSEFSVDAARVTVIEMLTAKASKDRQHSADKILDRALGKPVERVANINMEVAGYSDEELEDQTRRLMGELGYKGAEGSASTFVVAAEAEEGRGQAEVLQSESGVPGSVLQFEGEDTTGDGGEPVGQDDDRGF